MDGLVSGASFSEILLGIEREFGLTVYFCDTFGRVNTGPPTDKFIRIFNTAKNLRAQMRADKFAMYNVPSGMIDSNMYLIGPVNKEDISSGVVIMGGAPEDIDFIRQALILLSKTYCYFNRLPAPRGKLVNDSLSYIIARELLLHNDSIAEKLISTNQDRFLSFKPGFCIAYFEVSQHSPADINSMASGFRRTMPYSYTVEKNGGFLAFMYCIDECINSMESVVTQLEAFCEKHKAHCCISSKFTDLNNRHAYVNQVETLLPICIRTGGRRVYLANDFYCEFLCQFTGNKLEPSLIDLTAILYLLDYDNSHSTNYLHTLDCYLSSGNNSTQAAKELFIDRSTLSYRLKKIVNIVPIDVDDPYIALSLKLGLIVLKTLHPEMKIPVE